MPALSKIGAVTLFVDDLARSKAWYQRTFELPVIYEDDDSSVLQLENTIVNLLRRSASHELVAPSAVAPGGAGATFQLTIWVDDADATCATLADRGVQLVNGPMDRAWGQRTACFADPDGNLWEIAQTLT